ETPPRGAGRAAAGADGLPSPGHSENGRRGVPAAPRALLSRGGGRSRSASGCSQGLLDTPGTLCVVSREPRDVGRNSVLVRRVAGKHGARAHAETADRRQQLLPHGDPATAAMTYHVGR